MIRLGRVTLAAALLVAALAPAAANTISRADLTVSCTGYTVTFYGDNWEPGYQIPVSWRIVVLYEGQKMTFTGSGVVTKGGANEFQGLWGPFCGTVKVLNPCEDGGEGSQYFWYDNHGAFTNLDGPPCTPGPSFDCPCGTDICRTPGFWGTHAGTEKKNSKNITQAVLDKVKPITICGQPVSTTNPINFQTSAIEAMCVSPSGETKLQLARQLTAAALNCVMTNGSKTCLGTAIAGTFTTCNDVCAGTSQAMSAAACRAALDCWNNGGTQLPGGFCQIGTCGGDPRFACESDKTCLDLGLTSLCLPTPGNCHDQPLVNTGLGLNFEPPGPAGSPDACNGANVNTCTIFSCP